MRRNRNGFTLIELLLVIAVIAILAAIVIGAYTSSRCSTLQGKAKNAITSCESTLAGGDLDAIASCVTKANDVLKEFCDAGCSDPGNAVGALVTRINGRLDTYRENLAEADRARVATVTKPC